MNSIHALDLFDSGASRSFLSTSFYRDFNIASEGLDRPLKGTIVVDRTVSVIEVS